VVIDTTQVTPNNFELEFVRAEVKAQDTFKLANEAIEEADFSL
jgi:hypothetical protein